MLFSKEETALLMSSRILHDVPQESVLALLAKDGGKHQLKLQKNEVFIDAGQVAHGLYIVVDGTIELFVTDDDGKERVLDFVKTGATLANETLFSDRPLQYSARCLTKAAVLYLPNSLVSEWTANHPAFARRLMTLIAEKIDFFDKDILTFCTQKAIARLVCYIVCDFDKAPSTPDGSHSLHLAIPRGKLASRLRISNAHLSRTFRELQDKSLIVPQGRGYFIPDVPALSKYVCPAGCDF